MNLYLDMLHYDVFPFLNRAMVIDNTAVTKHYFSESRREVWDVKDINTLVLDFVKVDKMVLPEVAFCYTKAPEFIISDDCGTNAFTGPEEWGVVVSNMKVAEAVETGVWNQVFHGTKPEKRNFSVTAFYLVLRDPANCVPQIRQQFFACLDKHGRLSDIGDKLGFVFVHGGDRPPTKEDQAMAKLALNLIKPTMVGISAASAAPMETILFEKFADEQIKKNSKYGVAASGAYVFQEKVNYEAIVMK